jgi:Fanconi-associated nuclease 1
MSLALFNRIRYLFYLNEHQDNTLLVLVDLQKVKFPTYKVNRQHSVFASREELLAYEQALQVEAEFEYDMMQMLAIKDKDIITPDNSACIKIAGTVSKWLLNAAELDRDPFTSLPEYKGNLTDDFQKHITYFASELSEDGVTKRFCYSIQRTSEDIKNLIAERPFLARFSTGWRFASMVHHVIPLLEKLKMYQQAVTLLRILLSTRYSPGRRGKCWNRLAINLEHLDRKVLIFPV